MNVAGRALPWSIVLCCLAAPALAQTTPPAAETPAAETPPPPAPTTPPLQLESPAATLRFGLLLQPQFESLGSATGASGMSNNIFVRRVRFLLGGTILKSFEFFFDTDFANLFKADAMGIKAGPGMFVQDAFATWKVLGDPLKIDLGFMLPPLSHNAVQSAASLLAFDYFALAFLHGNVFGSTANPIGRDAGLQLRGLVLVGHLEYRLGLFQGKRNPEVAAMGATPAHVGASNMFRFAGRLQFNVFDPENAFFYAGTYHGTKKVLSFGAFIDVQGDYLSFGADGLLDLPLGANVLSAQVDVVHWNGKGFVVLPDQTAIMGEVGFKIGSIALTPIVRVELENFAAAGTADVTRVGGGLAYWFRGHNSNVKAFYNNISTSARSWSQIVLQYQYFIY